MPYCCVIECKNYSSKQNVCNGGVSYHRFPKDPICKEKWIVKTGRTDWMPTKSSTICSNHFLSEHLIIAKNGNRFLKPTAVPTLKIAKIYDEITDVDDSTAGPSKRSIKSEGIVKQTKKKIRLQNSDSDKLPISGSQSSTTRKVILKKQLEYCQIKIREKNLKIKNLQKVNLRLRNKLTTIALILTNLKDKFAIKEELS